MNSILRMFVLILALGSLFISTCFAALPTDSSLAPMLQKILPAIVNVRAQVKITDIGTLNKLEIERRKRGDTGEIPDSLLSLASGVIVDANKGYILTNAHAVDSAQTILVTLNDGRHASAKLIGIDKASDIAVLQIKTKNLSAIPFGDSNLLKVGDIVAAIGSPYGLNQSVTSGIVSALGRATLGFDSFENFIQTDASINPGNSGGALVNTQGQLIGINTAILTPTRGSIGIGFAIPSNMAKSVMLQLIEFGDVRRGTLGIGAQDITPELNTAFNLPNNAKGAVVTQIIPGSPAAKNGIEVGDIVTSVNGTNIQNANDVVNAIAALRVDSKANIGLLRKNKAITIGVVLTDPKKRKLENQGADPFLYGVGLKNFTLLSPIHNQVRGVLVVSIDEDTNAWRANLLPGDVITSAQSDPTKGQQIVQNIEMLKKIATDAKDALVVHILRGGGAIFLVINKEP